MGLSLTCTQNQFCFFNNQNRCQKMLFKIEPRFFGWKTSVRIQTDWFKPKLISQGNNPQPALPAYVSKVKQRPCDMRLSFSILSRRQTPLKASSEPANINMRACVWASHVLLIWCQSAQISRSADIVTTPDIRIWNGGATMMQWKGLQKVLDE